MGSSSYYIADFDSTTSTFLSIAYFLKGKGFNSGGIVPNTPKFVAELINSIPENTRRGVYRWSGWYDAFVPEELAEFREDKLTEWVVNQYPKKEYPGIMIGSSNGAATYLCAALGIPYLPQTFLLPVRRTLQPDQLIEDMEWGSKNIPALLNKNPYLQVHQMHDPVQDRLMVEKMAYLRIKKRNLGGWYKDFIRSNVKVGSSIFIVECNLSWPVVEVSDRYYFQSGGLGALQPGEISQEKKVIEEFLKQQGSSLKKWIIPEPTTQKPEAEWGFVNDILEDIKFVAAEKKMKICRIVYEKPDDLSPLIADLYRWWYKDRRMDPNRLIAECFALLDPWRAQSLSCVPYWLAFNTDPSAQAFEDYLNSSNPPFDEIYIKLMSNGIKSIGLTSVERWESIISKARLKHSFLGLDKDEYPLDLGSYGRFHLQMEQEIQERFNIPLSLSYQELEQFLSRRKPDNVVKFIDCI